MNSTIYDFLSDNFSKRRRNGCYDCTNPSTGNCRWHGATMERGTDTVSHLLSIFHKRMPSIRRG
jgi:hypothetical protein